MYLRTCGSIKSANPKKIGFANRNFAKCHICGTSANLTNFIQVRKFADLRFADLFAGRTPLLKFHAVQGTFLKCSG